MKTDKLEDASQKILALAGIKINGENPWDITIHNRKFYQKVLSQGSLGLGESYMMVGGIVSDLMCSSPNYFVLKQKAK